MLAVARCRAKSRSIVFRFGDSRNIFIEPFLRDARSLLQQVLEKQPHEVAGSLSRVREYLTPQPRLFASVLTLDEVSQLKANLRRDATEAILSGVGPNQ